MFGWTGMRISVAFDRVQQQLDVERKHGDGGGGGGGGGGDGGGGHVDDDV